jgi:SAM-dependent methyltransferase
MPTRALQRVKRALRRPTPPSPQAAAPGAYDGWLALLDDVLGPIDAACAAGERDLAALCGDLDLELWALLLTQEYRRYPHLRAVLPSVPAPELQARWNGTSGVPLASQGAAFYRTLCARYAQAGARPLADSRVLDFGCGWGRLTRFLARDLPPGRLHGCDPVESILDVCREYGVPATLARSDFLPERLPFDESFDLAFAFSVFTHLSERAHERCLAELHGGLRSGGILVATIRPPAYLYESPLMESVRGRAGEPFVFAPHGADPSHPQYAGPEMDYGETVIALDYVRERWARWFELLHVDLLLGDLHQVVLTLRRRG